MESSHTISASSKNDSTMNVDSTDALSSDSPISAHLGICDGEKRNNTFFDPNTQITKNAKGVCDEARLLFICETPYQLFNAIQIKKSLYPNEKADLVLTNTTNVAKYRKNVEKKGVFINIYQSEFCEAKDYASLCNALSNGRYVKNPSCYQHIIEFHNRYTDYFMPVLQSPYQALVYYSLISQGMMPRVHIFEEGSLNYTEQAGKAIERDGIDHTLIPKKKRLASNIVEILVRKPEQYVAIRDFPISEIPNISSVDMKALLYSIFGKPMAPREQFIFFAEPFIEKGLTSDDVNILDRIAEIVGKKNITVKLHPRCIKERYIYKRHGYTIFEDDSVWEVLALDSQINSKVLISVSSNSLNTPWVITGQSPFVIYLYKIMKLSMRSHVKEPLYKEYQKKAEEGINRQQKKYFCPNSNTELIEVLKYIKGEVR